MKKIVLGCAALLLSLGLLAGCDDNPSTVDAVIINVDSSASVVVGETLELPYSVEPEKATVVAASDHEEYVTADAQDGILYLHGVTEGSAIVTLVGTYKKYAEANTNISVKVVTEGEVEQEPGPETGGEGGDTGDEGGDEPETLTGNQYKLGVLNENLYTYYYFDGTLTGSNDRFGGGTENWEDAVTLTMETSEEGTTLSWEEGGTTYYLGFTDKGGNGSQTALTKTEDVAYLAINDTYNSIENADGSYFLGSYSAFTTFSWNGTGYYDEDFVAHLYQEVQTNPEKPYTPEFELATSLVSGETYYLGAESDDLYYLVTGSQDNNSHLLTSAEFADAAEVVVTGDDTNGWTITINGSTLYAYINGNYCNFELVAEHGSVTSGTNYLWFWDSTLNTLTVPITYNDSYGDNCYLEYYNGYVTGYAYKTENAGTITNAAHFYTLVEE